MRRATVGKVLDNVDAFTQAQHLTGIRYRGERLINAAKTLDEARMVT